jgi:hypothetical protein
LIYGPFAPTRLVHLWCAGNYCVGGSEGKERGNGRIVVSESNDKSGDDCGWDPVKTVEIPSKAAFMDYSGMAFRGNKVSWHRCVCQALMQNRCSRQGSLVTLLTKIRGVASGLHCSCLPWLRNKHPFNYLIATDVTLID